MAFIFRIFKTRSDVSAVSFSSFKVPTFKVLSFTAPLFASLLASVLLLSACAEGTRTPSGANQEFGSCKLFFNQVSQCANLIWEEVPRDDNDGGSFYLEFFDQSNPSVPMSPQGNPYVFIQKAGSGLPAEAVTVEAKNFSQYFVGHAHVNSRGGWDITVQLRTANGLIDQAVLRYNRL